MTYLYRRSSDILYVPVLKDLVNSGFRLYLNDFHGYTETGDSFELDRVLEGVFLNLYDFSSSNYLLNNIDILSYRDVEQDNEGRYYIDILYSDLPSSIRVVDGDYLLAFTSILNNNKIFTDFSSSKKYVDVSYFRYRYYADSGVGMLIPTDDKGEPIEPDTPVTPDTPSQDDKTSEAINNQTNVIKEQTGAINNQTQKIEEQTNAINEQNKTSKSIWQTLLDLPRDIN